MKRVACFFLIVALGRASVCLLAAAHPLAWQERAGYRFAPVAAGPAGKPGFTALAPARAGVGFTNRLSDQRLTRNSNLMNGSGVALGDIDGDGRCDLYFCGLESPNALYRNLGDWRFEDITSQAGVACADELSRGAAFADLDGDGDLDLLVTTFGHGVRCFRNEGGARFTDLSSQAGLLARTGSTSLALADLDGDGDLEVYVANFGEISLLRDGGQFTVRMVGGKPAVMGRHAQRLKIVDGKLIELGEADALYRNDGNFRFHPLQWTETFVDEGGRPLAAPLDFGLAVQIRDLNDDGHPDIYVCNDFQTPDRIWVNDGRGRFRALASTAVRASSYASMGVDFADIDRDGHLDFFVVEMMSRDPLRRLRQLSPHAQFPRRIGQINDQPQIGRNTLYWNRGDFTFGEIAEYSGVAASDWSWHPLFLDIDLDGFEDILITNGHTHDLNDLDLARSSTLDPNSPSRQPGVLQYPKFESPNVAYRNRGDLTFEDKSIDWGFRALEISHGAALADLDQDGDQDVVVNCLNAAPLIYRNDAREPRIAVRLKGQPPNTQGIGARIRLTGGRFTQAQEIVAAGRYLSGDEPLRVFAARGGAAELALEIAWRSGRRSRVSPVHPNAIYEISEPAGAVPAAPPASGLEPSRAPLHFTDVSSWLEHLHVESAFDDFAVQPLVPRRLSQSGPGLAWFDLDGDGFDDLIIGAGRGGALGVFRNHDGRGFQRVAVQGAFERAPADLTGVLACRLSAESRTILSALNHAELSPTNVSAILLSTFTNRLVPPPAAWFMHGPLPRIAPGPLAIADVDGDHDLDLFVGGLAGPGRYPYGSGAALFLNHNGAFEPARGDAQLPADLGIVNGALFCDLTRDGFPELVLACEWGPIRIFSYQDRKWTELTRALGLEAYKGWWQGIAAGDLDGDGQLDLVAANWGLNTSCKTSPEHPYRLYFGDLDQNGSIDLIEASPHPSVRRLVPRRNLLELGAALPGLRAAFASHRAFSEASIERILSTGPGKMEALEATTFASMIFFNRQDRFDAVPLPREAQFAPAFGVTVADFDGDGFEDLFLSQNFFATRPEDPRLDGGRGLWLRGTGGGNLEPVPGQVSGLQIYGEQRGCAVADFDRDGRIDLAVAQNGAATKLYRNTGARPGLRVRLSGPGQNPDALGAVVRLHFGQRSGPAREIRAGSGYWSQDSPALVLAAPEPPTQLSILWPGGKTTATTVPSGARELVIDSSGQVVGAK